MTAKQKNGQFSDQWSDEESIWGLKKICLFSLEYLTGLSPGCGVFTTNDSSEILLPLLKRWLYVTSIKLLRWNAHFLLLFKIQPMLLNGQVQLMVKLQSSTQIKVILEHFNTSNELWVLDDYTNQNNNKNNW